ncbi:MAG TPA: YIP1 family protein [archaeon]|nr:YIP1 family protein [archaeon]
MKILLKDSDLFFEKEKPSLCKDAGQAALLIVIFSALTTITFYVGWTKFAFSYGAGEAMVWITASTATGFLAVTALLSLIAFRRLDKKSFGDALFIMAYASSPIMLLAWAPHSVVKVVGIAWSIIFLKSGLEFYSKKPHKESILIAILTGAATIALAWVTEFYLIYYI